MIASDLWDWVAALTGLRPINNLFLPTYWCVPAELTAPGGWVFTPAQVLAVLIAVSLIGVLCYIWRGRHGFLHVSFAIWGALFADTPHILWVPLVVGAAWNIALHVTKFVKSDCMSAYIIPWRRLICVFGAAFIAVFFCNLSRMGLPYIPGYARNAIAAIRWDGGWHPFDTPAMDELLDEYVTELNREAQGKRWIFTDGLCDTGIELKGGVSSVSLAGGVHDEEHWRSLGFVRQEDLSALEKGASGLLRVWAIDHKDELTNAVFQCGFAFLEKEAAGKLALHGLVLRSPDEVTASSDRAANATRELGERIVGFYRDGGNPAHGGRIRQARFCAMQWRVARAIRRQAAILDQKVRTKDALAATALSEELDRINPFAKKQIGTTESIDLRAFGSMTPREGLAFSLRRANYALGRQFALPIIKDDPDNPEANFALAMSHLAQQEHAQARHYFEIALRKRPNDATLLNNIAVSSMLLGDLKDAEEKAKAALKVKPDSEAIKDTLLKVQSAKKGK